MRIAVIGTGVSGLAAAWLLARRHDVVLLEQDSRAGGHSNTVTVAAGDAQVPVDTGFIVYNEPNYPHLTRLFATLGVTTRASDMSFGVSVADGRYEYAGDSLSTLFLQASNLVSPRHYRMLLEILRLNALCKRLLASGELPEMTLGEFLDAHGFGQALRARYLCPMAGAIWSTSTHDALLFPFPAFARFFDGHGLFNAVHRPQWRTVAGGSGNYVSRLLTEFRGELRLGAAVRCIRRTDTAAWITTDQGEEAFDQVVCATHSDQALRLLADADDNERAVLSAIPYATNTAYLHTDDRLLPRRRRAWSSWNVMLPEDGLSDAPVPVTYWMNRLQGLPGPTNYIVSLNPPRLPRDDAILYHTAYAHPQYRQSAIAAQARLPSLQGRRRVWWAGAWTGYGFHEDGLRSGLCAAAALGCPPPWAADADLLPRPHAAPAAADPLPEAV